MASNSPVRWPRLVMSARAPAFRTPIILSANASDLAWSSPFVVTVLPSFAAYMMAPGEPERIPRMNHLAFIHPSAWKEDSPKFAKTFPKGSP